MANKYSEETIQKIIDEVNILDYISQYVELTQHGNNYVGICLFHGDSDPSFSVCPDKNIWYCFGCGAGSTIIDFVMKYHKKTFIQAVEHLINYSGLEVSKYQEPNIVSFLKKKNKVKNKKAITIDRTILSNNIMNNYKKAPIQEWLNEGMKQDILDKFQVRYDIKSSRIVFPIHDNKGNIINIKGRTLYENFKELGISKYIYYYPLGKLDFLYGLHQNREQINKSKEIICFEGSKSVYQLNGWGWNNTVSFETNRISDEQIPLILSLKKDVVISLDKGISYKDTLIQAHKLSRFINVYIIWDNKNLLNDKDAPCDKGIDVWNQLYLNKIKVKD